jgi:ribosome-associated toxin RatA of RatAB toxin-antitoxin module
MPFSAVPAVPKKDKGLPMAEHATEHLNVNANVGHCIDVTLDFARYPEWAPDIKESTVLEVDDRGRGTKVAFRAAAMGRSASYVLRYSYAEDSSRIEWELIEGDIMRGLDGSYVFESGPDGSTDITYNLTVELMVPIPGFVKRRAEGKIMTTALRELKHRVESLAVQ